MPTFDDPVICNSPSANAIEGTSVDRRGVVGKSEKDYGIRGHSTKSAGIRGSSAEGRGVEGWGTVGEGVVGLSEKGTGVWGQTAGTAAGVLGTSKQGTGVYGTSESTAGNGYGVCGEAIGTGVVGISRTWHGVYGESHSTTGGASVCGENKKNGVGVLGRSQSGVGVWGASVDFEGVHAETKSRSTAALAAFQTTPDSDMPALYAKHNGYRTAAVFEGKVHINGDVHVTKNITVDGDVVLSARSADCAEEFDIAGDGLMEPGTVMVLGDEGALSQSRQAYDKRVAGVISGAGDYRPGIVLDKQPSQPNRQPIALVGKVYCKVDASHASIAVGDLLTTSPSPGHAMKAADPSRAFGAVIGKALRPLKEGCGLIPILIALQ